MVNAEQFACRIYNVPEVTTTDKVRVTLYKKALHHELLPPTRHAEMPYYSESTPSDHGMA